LVRERLALLRPAEPRGRLLPEIPRLRAALLDSASLHAAGHRERDDRQHDHGRSDDDDPHPCVHPSLLPPAASAGSGRAAFVTSSAVNRSLDATLRGEGSATCSSDSFPKQTAAKLALAVTRTAGVAPLEEAKHSRL